MNTNQIVSTDLYGKKYYKLNDGVKIQSPACNPAITFADINYKGTTCSNGFKKISWSSNTTQDNDGYIKDFTMTQTYNCNNMIDSPVNKIETKELLGTKLQDIDFAIDCGNHPITYINLSRQGDKSILQYSCGHTTTNIGEYINNIWLSSDRNQGYTCPDDNQTDPYVYRSSVQSIDCSNNGVITRIKHDVINGKPKITYTCKQPITTASTPNILQQSEIFNTNNKSNYIQELNIQANNFDNPNKFWTNHKYTSTIPTSTTEYLTDTTINDDFFGVSCGKYGISGMTNKNGKVQYGCGKDTMYDLHVQEYNVNRDPFLQKYYNSGVLFDKVKCKDNEVLSSFNRTITKDGPKIQWVCGKLL